MPKVVITMPAYHAEGTLARTVQDIPVGTADELILVDDASSDKTVQVARDLGGMTVYVHPENRGYGGNQKTCYTKALEHGADIVVLLHPDYQYDPKAVPLLIAPILAGYADFTFGSRFAGLGDPRAGGMPLYRFFGNQITTKVQNALLGSRFSELHSGLRAYTRECLLSLPFLGYTDDFAFDSQMLADAVTSGLRVVEVPIPTRYTKESSSISVLRSLKYVSQSVWIATKRWFARGRRGRRYPPTLDGNGTPPKLKQKGQRIPYECIMCGAPEMDLVYPANASSELLPSEFACTADALGVHDDIVQCPECGLVSSRPTVSADEIVANYEQMEDEDYLVEQEGRRELFEWLLGRLDSYPTRGKKLFEVGANVGLFLRVASDNGWDASGIEPSRWAVETGREKFGVDLKQGILDNIDLDAISADAVVMLDVLEHLTNPLDDLRRLRKVVNDEGILAVSTVNVAGRHARVRRDRWPWFIRPHLHYFTAETLDSMLEKAGFNLVAWMNAPRSFHLSYIARRGRGNLGLLGRVAEGVTKVADPRLPLGWLEDVVVILARPHTGASRIDIDPERNRGL